MSIYTYNYPGPAFAHGGPQTQINIGVVHDIEAPIATPGMARQLAGPNYFGHGGDPGNPVSIHYVVGFDDICTCTPDGITAWHVGKGNDGTLGLEQCGYASMTRAEWLAHPEHLANVAACMADISARHPLIRLRWLTDDELVYAWHHKTEPGGWTTHGQMTRVGLGSNHTDPGAGWPADVVMELATGTTPTPPLPAEQDDDMLTVIASIQTGAIYMADSRTFAWIPKPSDYDIARNSGMIPDVPMDKVKRANDWDIEWRRGKVIAWGGHAEPMYPRT